MSTKQKAKLRALSTDEVTKRCQRAMDNGNATAFWRYYFELALRKLERQPHRRFHRGMAKAN